MADEDGDKAKPTWRQKLLFYTTAFFVLLGIFSVFSFLFLVPFIIDPAFTTIFMEFEETPALCKTAKVFRRMGVSNCSWSSCREGCTKDVYDCTQIYVNYKIVPVLNLTSFDVRTPYREIPNPADYYRQGMISKTAIVEEQEEEVEEEEDEQQFNEYDELDEESGLMGNTSEWYYKEARLLPNVKGCGYPPSLNCTIFLRLYKPIGTNYPCYYSRIDPSMVISHLDMWQVYMNLVYAIAIPIPSFIVSVIYLVIAYFKIYTDDEEKAPLEKNAEEMDVEGLNGPAPLQSPSGGITPASEAFREDLASFGHHFKVAMVDEMSRESFPEGVLLSSPIGANLSRAMATSTSTTGGPVAVI